jgi:alcohol dehydrogenase (cytochrome c)
MPSRAPRRFVRLLVALPVFGAAAVSAAQPAVGPARSAKEGVYTEEQLARGRAAHQANCISCHNQAAYKGEAFVQKWAGRSAFDFFALISSSMPQNEPGVLAREEYTDITAFVLWLNGYPAGSRELVPNDEELRRVRLDPPTATSAGPAAGGRQVGGRQGGRQR